jgi:ABC-type Fe3+ transport system substrate-binding protein
MASSEFSNGLGTAGKKTVGTAGTAEALVSSATDGSDHFGSVTLKALAANVGQVYVGGSDVASSTNSGLDAGETLTLASATKKLNLSDIYLDVGTDDDGVDFYAMR